MNAQNRTPSARTAKGLLLPLLIVLVFASPALAALGGTVDSVQKDQVQMKGTMRVASSTANYTVHEIQASTGTLVREYVSPAGIVFGVAWRGPARPDLQQVFGSYYDQFIQAAKEAKSARPGRRPLNIQQPGLVVYSGGHMGNLFGKAYIPQLLPQGVTAADIQ
jgi:hypothetical protein